MPDTQTVAIQEAVIATLKSVRKERGLSQSELAKLAGVSRSTITHMEDGSSRPTFWVLVQTSRALGVELWELVRDASSSEGD